MGSQWALQRRGGGQGDDASLPDAEPQIQGSREGGPNNPGRVQAGPAHGGQVHGHHAQGQGDEYTVQRPRHRRPSGTIPPRKRY